MKLFIGNEDANMLYVNQLKPFGKIVLCTVYGSCNFLNSKPREMSRAREHLRSCGISIWTY